MLGLLVEVLQKGTLSSGIGDHSAAKNPSGASPPDNRDEPGKGKCPSRERDT